MKKFIAAFREYHYALTIKDTTPTIFFRNNKWVVSYFYKHSTIKRIGGEIIL